jgi:hypothetical protein
VSVVSFIQQILDGGLVEDVDHGSLRQGPHGQKRAFALETKIIPGDARHAMQRLGRFHVAQDVADGDLVRRSPEEAAALKPACGIDNSALLQLVQNDF